MADIPIRTRARAATEEGGATHPKAGAEGFGTAAPSTAPTTPAAAATVSAATAAAGRAASPAGRAAASAARRAGTEARRTLRGMPSRAYVAVAAGALLLAALCGLSPVLGARLLLPTGSPAFATAEQTLAGEALATVIEAARHGVRPKGLASVKKTVSLIHPYDTLFRLVGAGSAVWALTAYTLRKAAMANKLSLVTYKRMAMAMATCGALELALLPRMLANLSWSGAALMTALSIAKVNAPSHQVRGEGLASMLKQCVKGMGLTSTTAGAARRRRGRGGSDVEEEATRSRGRASGATAAGCAGPLTGEGGMGGLLGFAWRAMALALAGAGFSYLLAPALTLKLATGTVATSPARYLWQTLGATNVGLSLVVLNLAMAAAQHRLAATTHTLESLAVSFIAASHLVLLARDYEGGRWGLAAPALAAVWGGRPGGRRGGPAGLAPGGDADGRGDRPARWRRFWWWWYARAAGRPAGRV